MVYWRVPEWSHWLANGDAKTQTVNSPRLSHLET